MTCAYVFEREELDIYFVFGFFYGNIKQIMVFQFGNVMPVRDVSIDSFGLNKSTQLFSPPFCRIWCSNEQQMGNICWEYSRPEQDDLFLWLGTLTELNTKKRRRMKIGDPGSRAFKRKIRSILYNEFVPSRFPTFFYREITVFYPRFFRKIRNKLNTLQIAKKMLVLACF